jgi:hypothetical protein
MLSQFGAPRDPEFGSDGEGMVQCRAQLGELLRYYYRDAA